MNRHAHEDVPWSHSRQIARGRRCDPCERTFPTRADLERHQEEKHRVKFIRPLTPYASPLTAGVNGKG